MSLGAILATFLDDADESEGTALRRSVTKLAADCTAVIADYSAGEVPALVQRCGTALIWLAAEQRDPNRSNRHGRQRAVLDLVDLCEAIRAFHAGKGDDGHLDRMRVEISAALRPFVDAGDA